MVVGQVNRHYIEISAVKGAFSALCSCGWKEKSDTRSSIKSIARLHIAGSGLANG